MLLALFVLTSLQAAHSQQAERIPTRIALNTSGAEGPARNGATFTVQVTGADGKSSDAATSAPTGSVSFMNGEHSIGAAFLDDQGGAALTVAALPAGEQKITAVYQGDDNFEAASSTPAVLTAEATGVPGFTLSASNTSLSVVAGNSVYDGDYRDAREWLQPGGLALLLGGSLRYGDLRLQPLAGDSGFSHPDRAEPGHPRSAP